MTWKDTLAVWQQADLPAELAAELATVAQDSALATEYFDHAMEFGTAGMRGVMAPGINTMNIYTVRQATAGLAAFMHTLPEHQRQQGVVISFDSRYHSQEFAQQAAAVLNAAHIKVYLFDSLRPTPELSFAVRYLKTYAGIMITASHNPKQYNGYKIYGPDGGQMPPDEVENIVHYIQQVPNIFAIDLMLAQEARVQHLLQMIGEDVDQAYLNELAKVTVQPDLIRKVADRLHLVYTPLHGTGKMLYDRVLRTAGVQHFQVVPEQAVLDPEFATVPYPNPEFPEAFQLAIALGKQSQAGVLIATDPDADRLGAAVAQKNGDYQLLSGNQLAALMVHYLLTAYQNQGRLPADGRIVKSIVSSEFPAKIAASFGIKTLNVLTGFKYIGEQIQLMEDTGKGHFLFGFEESYGYLVQPFVRDKDAMQATVLLAEVAAYYRAQNMTMYDGLQALFREYGYFDERTISIDFTGLTGPEKMAALMSHLRQNRPTELAGVAIKRIEDYGEQRSYQDDTVQPLALPKANVLKFYLTDDTWIAVRPSGTEPKIKLYVGVVGTSEDDALSRLNNYAHALSDLVKA